jgi:rhamnosyltransferase
LNSLVSVVIRSYTRSDEIFRVIDALARQSQTPGEFVVIDSGSADRIIDGLRGLARSGVAIEGRAECPCCAPATTQTIPLRLIEIPNSQYQSARALNWAIREARGEAVAIISQDALPDNEHYLERLRAPLDDARVAASYARQILMRGHYDPLGEKDLMRCYPPTSRLQDAPNCWFANTCSMVRRSLWEEHPFDEGAIISEDHEWAKWAQSQGYAIAYAADAVVQHYHYDYNLGDLWRRYHGEGRGLYHIHGRSFGLFAALFNYAREVVSDGLWLARHGKFLYWPFGIYQRTVKFAALYCGFHAGRAADGGQGGVS